MDKDVLDWNHMLLTVQAPGMTDGGAGKEARWWQRSRLGIQLGGLQLICLRELLRGHANALLVVLIGTECLGSLINVFQILLGHFSHWRVLSIIGSKTLALKVAFLVVLSLLLRFLLPLSLPGVVILSVKDFLQLLSLDLIILEPVFFSQLLGLSLDDFLQSRL